MASTPNRQTTLATHVKLDALCALVRLGIARNAIPLRDTDFIITLVSAHVLMEPISIQEVVIPARIIAQFAFLQK